MRGQDLVRLLDCSGAVVTAAVSESVYNRLHIGQSASFVLRGEQAAHTGQIVNLTGVASAPANLAIQPSALAKEPYRVTVRAGRRRSRAAVQGRPHRTRHVRPMSPTASILLEALAPGILVIGALLVALPWLSPRDERARAVMVVVIVVLMWRYMFWRWSSTLPAPELSLDFAVGLIFVVIETLAVLGSTINLMFVSRLKDRSPDADRNLAWLAVQPQLPLVDVFICTYNEEAAILERTIVGALSLNYANKRVWVLDDGRRAWLRDLSTQLGANYLTRTDNAHAKAGNINNGLLHVASLERAAGLHRHPRRRFRADAELPRSHAVAVPRERRRHRPDAAALHQSGPAAEQSRRPRACGRTSSAISSTS